MAYCITWLRLHGLRRSWQITHIMRTRRTQSGAYSVIYILWTTTAQSGSVERWFMNFARGYVHEIYCTWAVLFCAREVRPRVTEIPMSYYMCLYIMTHIHIWHTLPYTTHVSNFVGASAAALKLVHQADIYVHKHHRARLGWRKICHVIRMDDIYSIHSRWHVHKIVNHRLADLPATTPTMTTTSVATTPVNDYLKPL